MKSGGKAPLLWGNFTHLKKGNKETIFAPKNADNDDRIERVRRVTCLKIKKSY